mmetsp:Transcript_35160/g.85994  ORF Transcript_35160/g.85994 Transcript_35160/m.85994 type:complete len:255 (+) Transcript_35160:39-803(+)
MRRRTWGRPTRRLLVMRWRDFTAWPGRGRVLLLAAMSMARRLRWRRRRPALRRRTLRRTAMQSRRSFWCFGRSWASSLTALFAQLTCGTLQLSRNLLSAFGTMETFTSRPTRASTAPDARSTRTPRSLKMATFAPFTKPRASIGKRKTTFSHSPSTKSSSKSFTLPTRTLCSPQIGETRYLGGSKRACATFRSPGPTIPGEFRCQGTRPRPSMFGLMLFWATYRRSHPRRLTRRCRQLLQRLGRLRFTSSARTY